MTAEVPLPTTIRRILQEFSVAVNDEQVQQIQGYMNLLDRWNAKINLTTIRDPKEILRRHFAESMLGADFLRPETSGRLADIGSGAGFPGLALAIIRPKWACTLVEASQKKAAFLLEVIRYIGLTLVQVHASRFEDVRAKQDVVCSRAVGDCKKLLAWARSPEVDAERCLLWLGGEDLKGVQALCEWQWLEPRAIPGSRNRFIAHGVRRTEK